MNTYPPISLLFINFNEQFICRKLIIIDWRQESTMNILKYVLAFSVLFLVSFAEAKPLSDSLPIEGHYSQGDHSVSRFKLERFLLAHDSSVELADRSLGYKWSGHAIGAMLWCVNLGVSAYQLEQFLNALKNQNALLDSTHKQVAFSNSLYKFTIPLTIGSDAATFVQSILYNRSDYLLHKAALAYNSSIVKNGPPIDLRIEDRKNGWYKQDGLLMTEPVLYGVLREQPASRARANWSVAFKQIGIQAGEWGGMYLALALLSYIVEASGDTTIIIDKKGRDNNLRIGVSLAVFGIVDAIVSAVTRNKAIKKYNAALPVRNASVAPVKNAAASPDSTGTGIIERPKNMPADTTSTKNEVIGK
jgi:hypothetical protein